MNMRKAILLGLVLAALPVLSAQANVAKPLRIPVLPPLLTTYDVYVGGFHFITAQIWFEEQKNAYRVVVKANTRGLWGKFFPWNTVLDARGRINGLRFEPKEYSGHDEWDYKPKVTKLHFRRGGKVIPEFDPPNTDKNREIVTDAQKKGSLDPVTALLQMLANVAVKKSCAIPVPVFDGKRRFDITGRDAGDDYTDSDGYGIYNGKARLCGADFKMISGEWKDRERARFWKKTETEVGREPFQIWLASPAKELPELPVRLESGSIAGLIVVHLTSWRYATAEEIKAQRAGK
ncbi:MAG: DUF3108 domain-containing protein [Bdellovibrionales bacterium]